VTSVGTVGGVCTVTVVIRAATDTATSALQSLASQLNTATLTQTSAVLQTAPSTQSGATLTMGSATVTQTTIVGQKVGSSNSGSSVVPSALVAASAMVMWLA